MKLCAAVVGITSVILGAAGCSFAGRFDYSPYGSDGGDLHIRQSFMRIQAPDVEAYGYGNGLHPGVDLEATGTNIYNPCTDDCMAFKGQSGDYVVVYETQAGYEYQLLLGHVSPGSFTEGLVAPEALLGTQIGNSAVHEEYSERPSAETFSVVHIQNPLSEGLHSEAQWFNDQQDPWTDGGSQIYILPYLQFWVQGYDPKQANGGIYKDGLYKLELYIDNYQNVRDRLQFDRYVDRETGTQGPQWSEYYSHNDETTPHYRLRYFPDGLQHVYQVGLFDFAGNDWRGSYNSETGRPDARVASSAAQSVGGGVTIAWSTASERNTAFFDVGRSLSSDGPWDFVGMPMQRAGTDTSGAWYEVYDPTGTSGHYYRIVETEVNGWRLQAGNVLDADEQLLAPDPPGPPAVSGLNPNYGIQTAGNGPPYDALIVTPDAWIDSLTALRSHWNGFRHRATLVAGLSETGTTKESIKTYILARPTLRFVLLVGDTQNLSEPANVIPTWLKTDLETGYMTTDAPYVDEDSDGLADVAIGRWPVHSSQEVGACSEKSIRYDLQAPNQGYRQVWASVTYDIDENLVSGQLTRELGTDLASSAPGIGVQYLATQIPNSYAEREVRFVNAINTGAHVLWALGTGADAFDMVSFARNRTPLLPSCFPPHPVPGGSYRYRPFDMSRLAPTEKYGFWFALSCDAGGYHSDDTYNCDTSQWIRPVAEDFLVARRKGPVVWFGPTAGTIQMENYWIAKEIQERMTPFGSTSVGEICMLATKAFVADHPFAHTRATSYTFLGDPTIVMAWDDVVTGTATDASESRIHLTAMPNPGNPVVRLAFAVPPRCDATLDIYSVSGRRIRRFQQLEGIVGRGEVRWDGADDQGVALSAGVYFAQLSCGTESATVRCVLIK